MVKPYYIISIASLTFTVSTFALPYRDPTSFDSHKTAVPTLSPSREIVRERVPIVDHVPNTSPGSTPIAPNVTPGFIPEGAESLNQNSEIPPNREQPALLVRDDVPVESHITTSPEGSCQVAADMLQGDFAGHGLPLTSLVIDISTLLLVTGFVLHFFLWRRRLRRHTMFMRSLEAPSPLIFQQRDSAIKHTPPTPAQQSSSVQSLSKIEEDDLPATPSQTASSYYISQAPALAPLRAIPTSPIRSISRSPSSSPGMGSSAGAGGGGGEKKASFLSLKG
ncbi:hypothetical protein C8Q77DRAFT_1156710 [Trametes polyzona]|nr:hypothetical protein C8Q77DRAFT_1156710 [Trametes polyzona]